MKNKKILKDHRRQRKTFIPPFVHMLGPLQEVSWVKTILPELLWIALIQNHHGHREGVALITSIARVARKCSSSEKLRILGTISSYLELSAREQTCLKSALAASGELFKIQEALFPLIVFYPECPLGFLFSHEPQEAEVSPRDLERLKTLVADLYDKTAKNTMMVQATMVWLAFDAEALKVFKGLALASFPEIEKYPDTELSKQVAASIRSTVPMFFREPHYPDSSFWPWYFWNRGMEIDRCHFEDACDD